jgi:hypothetical protein
MQRPERFDPCPSKLIEEVHVHVHVHVRVGVGVGVGVDVLERYSRVF